MSTTGWAFAEAWSEEQCNCFCNSVIVTTRHHRFLQLKHRRAEILQSPLLLQAPISLRTCLIIPSHCFLHNVPPPTLGRGRRRDAALGSFWHPQPWRWHSHLLKLLLGLGFKALLRPSARSLLPMVVTARLGWLRQRISAGVPGLLHIGSALDPSKCKVKVILNPHGAALTPVAQALLLGSLDIMEALIADRVVVDRGHKHSSGAVEASFWISDGVRPHPHRDDDDDDVGGGSGDAPDGEGGGRCPRSGDRPDPWHGPGGADPWAAAAAGLKEPAYKKPRQQAPAGVGARAGASDAGAPGRQHPQGARAARDAQPGHPLGRTAGLSSSSANAPARGLPDILPRLPVAPAARAADRARALLPALRQDLLDAQRALEHDRDLLSQLGCQVERLPDDAEWADGARQWAVGVRKKLLEDLSASEARIESLSCQLFT